MSYIIIFLNYGYLLFRSVCLNLSWKIHSGLISYTDHKYLSVAYLRKESYLQCVFLAELFQQLCSLNWKFFWPEISFEAMGGWHISRDYEGGWRGGCDDARGHHRGGTTQRETTRVTGDDAEGGHDIRGHHRGWDNMWCPPCHPPLPASSPTPASCPLQCGVS